MFFPRNTPTPKPRLALPVIMFDEMSDNLGALSTVLWARVIFHILYQLALSSHLSLRKISGRGVGHYCGQKLSFRIPFVPGVLPKYFDSNTTATIECCLVRALRRHNR